VPHQPLTKTCVSPWLGPTLDLAATAQRSFIASASETSIDRKIMILWLEGHGGEATMWCSQSAMPCSGGAELSSATWAPINLCKLSGPAMFEASRWG
jgi:hypothetical protein